MIPGALTPTEVISAWETSSDLVKVVRRFIKVCGYFVVFARKVKFLTHYNSQWSLRLKTDTGPRSRLNAGSLMNGYPQQIPKEKHVAEARRINRVHRALPRPLAILGAERKLFFFAMCLGAGTFNLLNSLFGGLLMFLLLYSLWALITRSTRRFCDFC